MHRNSGGRAEWIKVSVQHRTLLMLTLSRQSEKVKKLSLGKNYSKNRREQNIGRHRIITKLRRQCLMLIFHLS